jgi:large subunit ribosomal protein L6e
MAHSTRNSSGLLSRSQVYKKRALYKRKKVGVTKTAPAAAAPKVKPIGGDNNGKDRVKDVKAPRFYPVEDQKVPLKHRKNPTIGKLRSSITPGTVLILLAGRHKGKRVVFLKQLPTSGLLLVTGPYKVNGVPLRRVPQSYVIATSTRIDISKLDMPESVTETMFARTKKEKKTEMFEDNDSTYAPTEERKAAQQAVDDQILPEISKVDHLRKYMQSLFTLRKGQYPHEMVF